MSKKTISIDDFPKKQEKFERIIVPLVILSFISIVILSSYTFFFILQDQEEYTEQEECITWLKCDENAIVSVKYSAQYEVISDTEFKLHADPSLNITYYTEWLDGKLSNVYFYQDRCLSYHHECCYRDGYCEVIN